MSRANPDRTNGGTPWHPAAVTTIAVRTTQVVALASLDRSSAIAVQESLGITTRAASQLIDTLVLRGYLQRHSHPTDRRRNERELTDRGHGAAVPVRRGVGSADRTLFQRLSARSP